MSFLSFRPKSFFSFLFAMVALGGFAVAAPPPNYYSTVTNQSGAALKEELRLIISGQRGYPTSALSYDGARYALQDEVDNVGGGQVRMLYTNELRSANEWPGEQSREHTWPQSLGADVSPLSSDMHHLFLCHRDVNSSRGNLPFGEIAGGTAVSNPTGSPLDQNYRSSTMWEVSPRHRGDVARAILYMDTRYSQLSIVNRGQSVGTNKMGFLEDLLLWHDQDPPDAFEIARNDRVFSYQNNRNPYIDNPQWVLLVYDPGSATVTDGDTVSVSTQNRAPSSTLRGADIPMFTLSLTAAANEWDTGLVSIENAGTAADGDLTVLVYTDANNNGIVDGTDVQLASSGFAGGSTSLNLAPPPRSTPAVTTRLLFIGRVSSGATATTTVQFRLPAAGIFHSSTGGNDVDPANSAFTSGATTIEAGSSSGTGDVFFSEYIEGTSLNKALEIYNATTNSVNLSGWVVEFYFNGNTTPSPSGGIALTGTIASGGTFVLADDDADAAILAAADQSSNSTFFNGNDAVVLRDDQGAVRDAIGRVGEDAIWGTAPVITQDAVLRRKSSVVSGDTDPSDAFDPAIEWDGFAVNAFDNLGIHTIDNPNESPVIGAVSATITEDIPGDVIVAFTDADDSPAAAFGAVADNASSGSFGTGIVVKTGTESYEARFVYTPPMNFFGGVTFDLSITDSAGPVVVEGNGLAFSVTSDNDDPVISLIDDQVINQGESSAPIPFTVSDIETPAANLTVSATSGNTVILPNANVVISGGNGSYTVTLTPAAGEFGGPVEVVVRADDTDGGFGESIFEVTVLEASAEIGDTWRLY